MKKNFYKIAMLVIVTGIMTVSCQKETPAPEARNQSGNSTGKVASGGGTTASTPATSYEGSQNPGGCQGGHK